jgi:hypothetical protein
MKRVSTNNGAPMRAPLEHSKHLTKCVEQSGATSKPFEEQTVVSRENGEVTRGKASFAEELEKGGSNEAEPVRDQKAQDEPDAEAQMRSKAEDIARQI